MRSYVYGSYVDEMLAILPASGVVGERKFVHSNHLYSVAALTDNSGAVVERYRYDAYGQRTVLAADGVTVRAGSSYGNQIGFTGRYLDKETGLWYFRARHYNAMLGKFLIRDEAERSELSAYPIVKGGYSDSYGLYNAAFIPNNLDPSGLVTITTVRKIPSDCGGRDVKQDWKLDKPAPCDGYLVQQVTRTSDASTCEGTKLNLGDGTFWESLPVAKGDLAPGFDVSRRAPRDGTSGWQESAGEVKFFCTTRTGKIGGPGGPDPATGWSTTAVSFTNGGPGTTVQPPWWGNPNDGGEATANRSAKSIWDCCDAGCQQGNGKSTNLIVSP